MDKIVNKKIRNATPTEIDGIKFRSKLEAYTYKQLKEKDIYADYESSKFVLMPGFTFKEERIRQITLTPDFVGEDFIIECKGHPNDSFPMKWKLFKWHLKENNLDEKYKLFIVHNQKEVREAIDSINKN